MGVSIVILGTWTKINNCRYLLLELLSFVVFAYAQGGDVLVRIPSFAGHDCKQTITRLGGLAPRKTKMLSGFRILVN